MKKKKTKEKNSTEEFDLKVSELSKNNYILRLYITGSTNRSLLAITNLKKICEEYLEVRYELEVIDLYRHPRLAKDEQIIAAPTFDKEKVLLGLDLREM